MAVISLKRKAETTLESAFEEWTIHAQARNLKKPTIENYMNQFKRFRNWYTGSIEGINTSIIEQYVLYLKPQVKLTSINTALRHLKALIRYWQELGYIHNTVKIRFLKAQEEVKEVYTEEELEILLKKPDTKKCDFQELRTWAIINFFVGTGARVGTVTRILIEDYDRHAGIIKYRHTKNGRVQYISVTPQLQQVLHLYLSLRGGEPIDIMFPSENNTKLLESSITHNIKAYCKKRGVREGNSHLFRHTFAKYFIQAGGDSLVLQQILGHSTLKMVEHYTKLWKNPVHNGFNQYNLLSKLTHEKITLNRTTKRNKIP